MKKCTEKGCAGPHEARGLCVRHYQKIKRSGLPPLLKKSLEDHKNRFMQNVLKMNNGCWLWMGGRNKKGYGIFKSTVGTLAHRFSWFSHAGGLADGELVLHKCDCTSCVNPSHLFLGTHEDNSKDMVNKGRQAKGSDASSATLTEEEVKEIVFIVRSGVQQNHVAESYRVSRHIVHQIMCGKSWTWLTGIEYGT